jgi:hypothetical protein
LREVSEDRDQERELEQEKPGIKVRNENFRDVAQGRRMRFSKSVEASVIITF